MYVSISIMEVFATAMCKQIFIRCALGRDYVAKKGPPPAAHFRLGRVGRSWLLLGFQSPQKTTTRKKPLLLKPNGGGNWGTVAVWFVLRVFLAKNLRRVRPGEINRFAKKCGAPGNRKFPSFLFLSSPSPSQSFNAPALFTYQCYVCM